MSIRLIFGLLGYALAIAQFFLTTSLGVFSGLSENIDQALFSFLLSILIILISDKASHIFDQSNLDKSIENIFIRFESLIKTEVAPSSESMSFIIRRISRAKIIRSSTLVFSDEMMNISKDIHFQTQDYKAFNNAKKSAIERGCVWTDISFENAREIIEYENYSEFQNYRNILVDGRMPSINFMILIYEDNTKEVFFGWQYDEINSDPAVIISREDRVVNIFISLYTQISNSYGKNETVFSSNISNSG